MGDLLEGVPIWLNDVGCSEPAGIGLAAVTTIYHAASLATPALNRSIQSRMVGRCSTGMAAATR